MSYAADPRVDAYIERLPDWQSRQQDRPHGGGPARRDHQRTGADRHVQADHREQPGRRLAAAQARGVTGPPWAATPLSAGVRVSGTGGPAIGPAGRPAVGPAGGSSAITT